MASTVVSSPGKVLLAGGYLVLDPQYSGVVVATSSRFYTAIRPGNAAEGGSNTIRVRSAQFVDATWVYRFKVHDGPNAPQAGVAQVASSSGSGNKFVQLALEKTLSLALEITGVQAVISALASGLEIMIVGDNDFYSQQEQLQKMGLPPDLASLARIPPFAPTGVMLPDVSKTGLGSSAALITSLVTALLVHFTVVPPSAFAGPVSQSSRQARELAHNLAQFVHCFAQGKVGSGFDVASAVFGSQIYKRFSPEVIQPLMEDATLPLAPILRPENVAWNYRVEPFCLPPHTRLLLADIHAGSNTPLLVSQVLRWRKEKAAEAHALWTALDQLNMSLAATLRRLTEFYSADSQEYLKTLKYISSLQSVQWFANTMMEQPQISCLEAFYEAHLLTEVIPRFSMSLKHAQHPMGTLSGVEIEPEQQTRLLDESVSLAGIIGGGVPGAGGFDAIWLLVCDPPEDLPDMRPLSRIERLWSSKAGVTPLLAEESDRPGLCIESLAEVPGLKELVNAV
ncbi:phosphomevalonate kinase [Vararia minispora EC-137]|uniref:Phosphomevalonate kinase n=1 Tax=Vararia minispora EC-137 TaxID=1314806 RepID=A0ACB8R030_9AGAM|nr:phosphomevalonate kinase [Vararia minispora EC-137]